MSGGDRFTVSSRCKLLVDEVFDLGNSLVADSKEYEVLAYADKVKEAEGALLKAQQQFPEDSDIIQVEARLRDLLQQEDRALAALERAWVAKPKGSGIGLRIARAYNARNRKSEALEVLKSELTRSPDDKLVHHAMAMQYLGEESFDPALVERHLRRSFSVEDQNYESRYLLAQFLFLNGDVAGSAALFDQIDARAPEYFRTRAPQSETVITWRFKRYSGLVEDMKDRYFFIRSGAYPKRILAPHGEIDSGILESLAVGQEVNFRIRFSRAGAVAVDVRGGHA
jgi:tetratricopeptide (TPR) repeat protein